MLSSIPNNVIQYMALKISKIPFPLFKKCEEEVNHEHLSCVNKSLPGRELLDHHLLLINHVQPHKKHAEVLTLSTSNDLT